jgi:hypothetical protein
MCNFFLIVIICKIFLLFVEIWKKKNLLHFAFCQNGIQLSEFLRYPTCQIRSDFSIVPAISCCTKTETAYVEVSAYRSDPLVGVPLLPPSQTHGSIVTSMASWTLTLVTIPMAHFEKLQIRYCFLHYIIKPSYWLYISVGLFLSFLCFYIYIYIYIYIHARARAQEHSPVFSLLCICIVDNLFLKNRF